MVPEVGMKLYSVFQMLLFFSPRFIQIESVVLVPLAPHFCLENPSPNSCSAPKLNDFDPNDLMAEFFKVKTPLKTRFIVDEKTTSKAQIIPMIGHLRFDNASTPAQMVSGITNMPQITKWGVLSSMTYFGGSYDQGQVLIPAPGWIKAAHQNAAEILGTVFFSPNAYGGNEEGPALDLMLTPKNGRFPAADKLIAVAKTYGFDGYFINQETNLSTQKGSPNSRFASFINYFHKKARAENLSMTLDWYQIPAEPLFTNDTNLLTNANGSLISDDVFLDYDWQSYNVSDILNQSKNIGYPAHKLDFGVYAYASPTGLSQKDIFSKLQSKNGLQASISEFAYENILIRPQTSTIAEQLQNEQNFWEPSDSSWPGASSFVNTYSAITSYPFASFFNLGQGEEFFIDGQKTDHGSWNDIGQQDYLPTWRFRSSNPNSDLNTSFNLNDAYYGSSSLEISGTIFDEETIDLFATRLSKSTSNQKIRVIAKALDTSLTTYLCYGYQRQCQKLELSQDWHITDFEASDDIHTISIKITGSKTPVKYGLKIGLIFVGSINDLSPPKEPEHLIIKTYLKDKNLYLSWIGFDDNSYEIYDGDIFIGRTYQNIFAVDSSKKFNLQICSVNKAGIRSEKIPVAF